MGDNPAAVVLATADDDECSCGVALWRSGLSRSFRIGRVKRDVDRDGNGALSAEELSCFVWLRVRLLDRHPGLGQHRRRLDATPIGDPSAGQLRVGVGPTLGVPPAMHRDSVIGDL